MAHNIIYRHFGSNWSKFMGSMQENQRVGIRELCRDGADARYNIMQYFKAAQLHHKYGKSLLKLLLQFSSGLLWSSYQRTFIPVALLTSPVWCEFVVQIITDFDPFTSFVLYRWFLGGVASLPEGKSWCLGLVQLHAKYRVVSATSSPYH